MINLAQQELMAALNHGWGDRDSTIAMLLQEERYGLSDFSVPPVKDAPETKTQ
jgi:hypothetical protein